MRSFMGVVLAGAEIVLSLHAVQTNKTRDKRHGLRHAFDLLTQHKLTFFVKANQVKDVLADITPIDINSSKSFFAVLFLLYAV